MKRSIFFLTFSLALVVMYPLARGIPVGDEEEMAIFFDEAVPKKIVPYSNSSTTHNTITTMNNNSLPIISGGSVPAHLATKEEPSATSTVEASNDNNHSFNQHSVTQESPHTVGELSCSLEKKCKFESTSADRKMEATSISSSSQESLNNLQQSLDQRIQDTLSSIGALPEATLSLLKKVLPENITVEDWMNQSAASRASFLQGVLENISKNKKSEPLYFEIFRHLSSLHHFKALSETLTIVHSHRQYLSEVLVTASKVDAFFHEILSSNNEIADAWNKFPREQLLRTYSKGNYSALNALSKYNESVMQIALGHFEQQQLLSQQALKDRFTFYHHRELGRLAYYEFKEVEADAPNTEARYFAILGQLAEWMIGIETKITNLQDQVIEKLGTAKNQAEANKLIQVVGSYIEAYDCYDKAITIQLTDGKRLAIFWGDLGDALLKLAETKEASETNPIAIATYEEAAECLRQAIQAETDHLSQLGSYWKLAGISLTKTQTAKDGGRKDMVPHLEKATELFRKAASEEQTGNENVASHWANAGYNFHYASTFQEKRQDELATVYWSIGSDYEAALKILSDHHLPIDDFTIDFDLLKAAKDKPSPEEFATAKFQVIRCFRERIQAVSEGNDQQPIIEKMNAVYDFLKQKIEAN